MPLNWDHPHIILNQNIIQMATTSKIQELTSAKPEGKITSASDHENDLQYVVDWLQVARQRAVIWVRLTPMSRTLDGVNCGENSDIYHNSNELTLKCWGPWRIICQEPNYANGFKRKVSGTANMLHIFRGIEFNRHERALEREIRVSVLREMRRKVKNTNQKQENQKKTKQKQISTKSINL